MMNKMALVTVLSFLTLSAFADSTAVIEQYLAKLTPFEKAKLGKPLKPEFQELFGGEITIQSYERAVIFVDKSGSLKFVERTDDAPPQEVMGDIEKVYHAQGGVKVFGKPLQGEIGLFNEKYRAHICRNSVLIWKREIPSVQSAIYKNNFAE